VSADTLRMQTGVGDAGTVRLDVQDSWICIGAPEGALSKALRRESSAQRGLAQRDTAKARALDYAAPGPGLPACLRPPRPAPEYPSISDRRDMSSRGMGQNAGSEPDAVAMDIACGKRG